MLRNYLLAISGARDNSKLVPGGVHPVPGPPTVVIRSRGADETRSARVVPAAPAHRRVR